MKKRILMMLLAFTMVVSLLPTVALAADSSQEEHKHLVCGASCTHNGGHADVEWTPWNGTDTIEYDANGKAYVYLSANATPSSSLEIPSGKTLYLCLNGKTLKTTGIGAVKVSGTLNLCDCCGDEAGKITGASVDYYFYSGAGVRIEDTGVFNMYSGSVANCSVSGVTRQDGGGVYVAGKFNMYGGAIKSCNISANSNEGGGVYVTGTGVFTMDGGVIDGCKAKKGGGVAAANGGTFIMNDGTITGCNTANEGGGVYITTNGNFTMNNGTITGCIASKGGGLYIDEGSVNLAGGSITDSYTLSNSTYGSIWLNGDKADMTISGPVTIKGKYNVDLNIYKSSNAKGVIHFAENGSLVLGSGEKLRIYVDYGMSKWSTKEATRFLTASSADQRNALKDQITLKVRDNTPEIYDYDIDNVHGLRFAEWNYIYYHPNIDPEGTLTLSGNVGYCFETVTVTVTPPADYRLVSLTAQTYSSQTGITLVPNLEFENVYTFEMPADSVSVTATFGIIREHALCQADNCNLDHAGNDILSLLPVSTEAELQYYATNGGSVYLANDIQLTSTITVASGKTLNLCLNGCKITPAQGFTGRAVSVSGTLNLTDCGTTGAITGFTYDGYGAGVHANNGCFIMYGGTISNNQSTYMGGGVLNQECFIMYGGTICGNQADEGGGVYNWGDAYIYGGTIENNTATENGDGLYHCYYADSLLLSGNPTISGNTVNGVDNNVYLEKAFTIDEDFAPDTAIGITTAEFGRFAIAAVGANIPDISVYAEKFTSEGNYPIYTQENALYIGYKITEEPDAENNYTVNVNSTVGESYQWLELTEGNIPVTDLSFSNGGMPHGTYNSETGWSPYSDIPGYSGYFAIPMNASETITVVFTEVPAVDPFLYGQGSGEYADVTKDGNTYVFTALESDTYMLLVPEENQPTLKATKYGVGYLPVDGLTAAKLNTENLESGTYACKVTWDMGTVDTSDDYTLTSAPVEYTAPAPDPEPDPAPAPSGGGHTSPSYKVESEVSTDDDGSVNLSTGNAKKGDTVTVTVTPDEYYSVETIIVLDAKGNEIEATKNEDGTFSFEMPASQVTVEPVFSWDNPFTDMPEDKYYTPAVEWALKNDITEGTSGTTFTPAAPCTRAQMVTFLWRSAGSPEPLANTCLFADVDMDSYYGKAVLWAIENGITNGTSDTSFDPDMECSRAHMAAFLCRMADGKAVGSGNPFIDVDDDAYYAEYVRWAVENGITEGTGEGKYSPNAVCTRGQMVTFLYRHFEE